MTLRPFKITYHTSKQHGLRHSILTHRGEYISKEQKLGKKFFDKLLSYPITAFGYDIFQVSSTTWAKALGDPTLNPKFDRTDVIKALDFWIEHWVYQNKKDYILEGTVNKDFELTVRELIETREAVLKMPADTQFVRQKIRSDISKGGKDYLYDKTTNHERKFYKYDGDENREITNMSESEIAQIEKEYNVKFTRKKPLFQPAVDQIVEFTENVLQDGNTSASTVDQFCYVVRKMTYKEYMERQYELYTYNINFFREDGPRFNFGGLDDESSPSMWGGRHSDGVSVAERPPNASSTDDDFQIISVPITAQTVTIIDDESDSLVFENMHLSSIDGFNFSADPDTSMTVPVVFTRDNTEITMNMFLTPTQQIHMFDGPLGTVHRIQITNPNDPNNWRVEIDGTEYHVVADINITTR